MLNGTLFSVGLDIVTLVILLVFVWKLFSSSKELAKLKNIDGSEIVFRSVIASLVVVVGGAALDAVYAENTFSFYIESIVGLVSALILLYGVNGFARIVKQLSSEG